MNKIGRIRWWWIKLKLWLGICKPAPIEPFFIKQYWKYNPTQYIFWEDCLYKHKWGVWQTYIHTKEFWERIEEAEK